MRNKTLYITNGAMIAAVYVACCLIFSPISYGVTQIRVAEALTILPIFTSAAIPGLFVGCLLSNIIGGGVILDVVFGSLATLIGAIGSYYMGKMGKKWRWFSPLAPIISNTLIVPFVLKYGYNLDLPMIYLMASIAVGEIISCGFLGIIFGKALSRVKTDLFPSKE